MNICSIKKALLCGALYGFLTFVLYVVFTCILYHIFKGESYIDKNITKNAVLGVPFILVELIGAVVSALVPILLLRYTKIEYYLVSAVTGFSIYSILFIILLKLIDYLYTCDSAINFPLNSLDSLRYGIFVFPIGSVVGLIIKGIINLFLLKHH